MAQQEIIPDDVKQAIKETLLDGLKEDVRLEVYTKQGRTTSLTMRPLPWSRRLRDYPTS